MMGDKATIWSRLTLLVVLLWTLLPIYWFMKNAFLTPDEIARFPPPLYPLEPTPAAFLNIFGMDYTLADGTLRRGSGQANQIIRGLINSAVVSAVVTLITLVVVLPLAYVFARLDFAHKNKLLFAILLAVALPPVSTLIPFYAMYIQLGLAGTLTGLIIVTLTITIPFVTWMLIGYFRNLPPVERLARIDGFSRFETFQKIILPLGKSGVAVAAVIAFLFAWNEYTYALVLVNGTTANTLPTAISGFLFQHPEPSHLAASLALTILPPALVAFFLQRHIAEMNLVDPVR
jgi:multiple sugar transport system permease protein